MKRYLRITEEGDYQVYGLEEAFTNIAFAILKETGYLGGGHSPEESAEKLVEIRKIIWPPKEDAKSGS